jgi:hypothetical protein
MRSGIDHLVERWKLWRFTRRGARRFAHDPRNNLQSVTEGFASRIEEGSADAALLERICAAYIKAVNQQQRAPEIYRATEWWEKRRINSLKPVIHALVARDIDALGGMYRNFYRDPCSAGLLISKSAAKDYFGRTIKDFHRRLHLIDTLYRLDYWKERTGSRFSLRDLSGPNIGNPFGVVLDGTLVRPAADYQHYSAHRIIDLLDSDLLDSDLLSPKPATVAEIGGGFGGMAYYLLRDRAQTTYIDFDVPESIALTSYYLIKTFPRLTFLLYGEEALTQDAISRADVVLMPLFEMPSIPTACAALTFSSHAMSDLSADAMSQYLTHVAAMTRDSFLYVGSDRSGRAISGLVDRQHPAWKLAESRASGWHDHRIERGSEVECLYRANATQ